MDNYYIYVFVRQDLSVSEQLIHSNHATAHMANLYGIEETPNLIVIGVPHQTSMNRVVKKLQDFQVEHFAWTDPDSTQQGITAVTTVPLSPQRKELFNKYKLYTSVAQ